MLGNSNQKIFLIVVNSQSASHLEGFAKMGD
jgi:hypothetical protein